VTLVEVLAELADREAGVSLRAGGSVWNGRVRGVGRDLVTLAPAGGRGSIYVRVESVSEISVSSSVL
jgi:hypothetical protein